MWWKHRDELPGFYSESSPAFGGRGRGRGAGGGASPREVSETYEWSPRITLLEPGEKLRVTHRAVSIPLDLLPGILRKQGLLTSDFDSVCPIKGGMYLKLAGEIVLASVTTKNDDPSQIVEWRLDVQ